MSKFKLANDEIEKSSEIEWPFETGVSSPKIKPWTVKQLLDQLPHDTKWPKSKIKWDLRAEIYNQPGDNFIVGISEIEIKEIAAVILYLIEANDDNEDSTHLYGAQVIKFLKAQPENRWVLMSFSATDCRPLIGCHENEDSNDTRIAWLQGGHTYE